MEILKELIGGDLFTIITTLIIVGLGIAAGFVNSKKKQIFLRYKSIVKEIKEGKEAYDEYKSKESEDGVELSTDEMKDLVERLGNIFKLIWEGNKNAVEEE